MCKMTVVIDKFSGSVHFPDPFGRCALSHSVDHWPSRVGSPPRLDPWLLSCLGWAVDVLSPRCFDADMAAE